LAADREKEFGDIPPPVCFSELFDVFVDIFYYCPEGISYRDIVAYSEANQRQLSMYEVSLIRRMSSWAAHEINQAQRESQ
jgi:hypothetical protein